ncbi:MAG TPA: helix-hairpin-helix domain-containing protein [Gemmatimonadaceae bacterium]|nr:helix-hairpin-helix domain-containing protein [Gemmatimonadaceae bacterium]
MPTPGERKALVFLGAVIVLGGGMRAAKSVGGSKPAGAEARAAIDAQIEAVDSARKSGKKKKGRKPKGRIVTKVEVQAVPSIIDLDVATAEQIETLRGIGPAMAKRIVEDRDSLGPFGSLKGLERVRGIGPKLAARIDSSVTFSLVPRLSPTESPGSSLQRGGRRPRRGKA